MAAVEFVPNQAETEAITAHVLWITVGLSCEGDTVAMTSATNPSLEDIITGAIPGMPKVVVHNQVLAYEVGEDYIQAWYDAEAGKLDPFVLVIEGSLGNEKINGDGHWTGFGVDRETGQPIPVNDWVDRLSGKAAAVVAVGTCATYGGIPAMRNNPTGAMGIRDYLGWNWKSQGRHPDRQHPRLPRPAGQHDRDAHAPRLRARGHGAGARARRRRPARQPVRPHRPRELQPRGVLRVRQLRHGVRLGPPLPGQARLQGPGGQVQRPAAGVAERHRRLPERRRHLHGLHDAGLPRQVHAVHGRGPDGPAPRATSRASPTGRCCAGAATATSRTSTTRSRSGGTTAPSSRPATRSAGKGDTTWPSPTHPATRRSSSRRCRGIPSPASSGRWASTRRSTSPTSRCSSATRRRCCSAASTSS